MRRRLRACLVLICLPAMAVGQAAAGAKAARTYVGPRQTELLQQFSALLAIPNRNNDTADIERNATAVAKLYEAVGVHTEMLRVPGAPPVVYGTLDQPGVNRTITFYAHYDGQPVHPADWATPPFSPVIHDGRIWARSAGDDKAAVFGFTVALAALRAANLAPRVNLHFFLEGEEEAGSPHLAQVLAKYAARLGTDAWVLCDGPVHQSGQMQVFFGARGVTEVEMTVYGPNRALHDGHYGNWAPNPIVLLTHLLDAMRDENAHILIPGFYRDVTPLDAADRAAITAIPPYDVTLERDLGLDRTEGEPHSLAEQIAQPALNVRGINGGYTGAGAANAISVQAMASVDFRLVPNQTPAHVRAEVEHFITAQGYTIVRQPPDAAARLAHPKLVMLQWSDAGYPAARTPLTAPFSREIVADVEAGLGHPIVKLPLMGGSIPMFLFQGTAHTPVVGLPIANYDDNQHAANENLRLDYLWNGIAVYASLFAGLNR